MAANARRIDDIDEAENIIQPLLRAHPLDDASTLQRLVLAEKNDIISLCVKNPIILRLHSDLSLGNLLNSSSLATAIGNFCANRLHRVLNAPWPIASTGCGSARLQIYPPTTI